MPNNLVTTDLENSIVLNIVNNELDTVTDRAFASPQNAYERVAKVLATVNIGLTIPSQFEDRGGMDVFDMNQYLNNLDSTEKLYLYFEYQKEDDGTYTVFAEVVNEDDLQDLVNNYGQVLNEMIAPNKHPMVQALKGKSEIYGDEGDKIEDKLSRTSAKDHKLGSGAFGAAYHRTKSNEVVKIYDDPGYHEFAKYAKANHHLDPHLPKIHSIGRIKGTNLGYVRMEKLNPIVHNQETGQHEPWIHDHGNDGGWKNVRRAAINHPTMGDSIRKAKAHLESKGHTVSLDLHSGNIMKRDDGTPVATDPFVSYNNKPHLSTFRPKKKLEEMIAPNKHPYIQALKRPIRKDNSGMSILSHLGGTDADKHSLGTGYFGSAYHRPNKNEVVKVYNDPAYHEYAKYARDHHHEDPHLPKITSVHRIKGTQLGVARMEKLNPTSMGDKWGDSQASREPWVGKNDDFEEAVKKHPTMKATLTKAHQHMASKGHKVWADVHSGNVMKRDDGTPVLTDPFATSTEARFSHFNPTKKTLKEMIAPNKHPMVVP